MPTYRPKPAVIDAWQLTDTVTGIPDDVLVEALSYADGRPSAPYRLWVEKSKSWCDVNVGDYIIREPDHTGYYPCARSIFEARWELVT